MPVVGAVNTNLCLFRLARTSGRDDFVDGAGHGGTWLFSNTRSIQVQFRYSCGSGHARLCHFLLDAGTCRVVGFFLDLLTRHSPIITSGGSHAVPFRTVQKYPADSCWTRGAWFSRLERKENCPAATLRSGRVFVLFVRQVGRFLPGSLSAPW